MKYKLRIAGKHLKQLREALYPGDGNEAGALALCARHESSEFNVLLVKEVRGVPDDAYITRQPDFLEWDKGWVTEVLHDAEKADSSIIKFHSHPGGFDEFSKVDDLTDMEMLNEWRIWYDRDTVHGSVIMLPNDRMFGRVLLDDQSFTAINSIAVAGDQFNFWPLKAESTGFDEAELRNLQTFGSGTTAALKNLKIGVVGCSGTGSVVVEQLARLGVGHLVIVDPDIVEDKNLNRILNATKDDANSKRNKVDVLGEVIGKMGFSTKVTCYAENLIAKDPIREIASCDVIFGCVDGAEGRHFLNRISTYYVIPYFDVGIDLKADKSGGIEHITGAVHYIQPGGSSLLSRGVYSTNEVESESMRRTDPELYADRLKQNYISGVDEDSPAVLPVNMHYASLLVLEFLARIHQYRITDNADLAIQQYNLEDVDNVYHRDDGEACTALSTKVGRGDVIPLLDIIGIE